MSHPAQPAGEPGAGGGTRPRTGPLPAQRLTPRRLALLAAALVAVLLVVWAVARGGDDPAPGAEPTSATVGPSDGATADPTAEPSADPGATPTEPPAAEPGATSAPADPPPADGPALPEPLAPRALTEEAEIGPEAVARVSRLEAVEGEPQGVGEVAGPALRFTIELRNTGTAPITVGNAVINVTYGEQDTPATEVSGPGRAPFTGDLAPGQAATGTYVFVVPTEERGAVSVSLEYRAGAPVAVFEGSASAAPQG